MRGIPLCELEVEIENNIYQIFASENGEKCEISLAKCKQIGTKTKHLHQNIPIFSHLYETPDGIIRIIELPDVSLVSSENIAPLLLSENGENIRAVTVASIKNAVLSLKCHSPWDTSPSLPFSLAYALATHFSRSMERGISLSPLGVPFFARTECGRLLISSLLPIYSE